jgi:hypothetical protein
MSRFPGRQRHIVIVTVIKIIFNIAGMLIGAGITAKHAFIDVLLLLLLLSLVAAAAAAAAAATAVGHQPGHLQQQCALAHARLPSHQDQRPRHKAAAQHP